MDLLSTRAKRCDTAYWRKKRVELMAGCQERDT
jgi:hypothetical protein